MKQIMLNMSLEEFSELVADRIGGDNNQKTKIKAIAKDSCPSILDIDDINVYADNLEANSGALMYDAEDIICNLENININIEEVCQKLEINTSEEDLIEYLNNTVNFNNLNKILDELYPDGICKVLYTSAGVCGYIDI